MKWIQVSLTFSPEQFAPFRKNGFGVWRVRHCSEVGNPLKTRIDLRPDLGGPILRMMAARPYRVGTIVNPVKLALEYNDAVRQNNRSMADAFVRSMINRYTEA